MTIRMISGLAVGLVLGAGMTMSVASAHEHGHHKMSLMDTNHDGMVSADEHAVFAKSMFDKMDANHDGMVTMAEMDAGMKMMHEEHERMEADSKDMTHEMKEAAEEKNEVKK